MQIQSFKKAGKIGKIILLGVANVLLLPICIALYPLGYECDIAATLLQVVLIWINYEYIRTTWKMCVMDVISMLFTAAGTLYAFILYQRNISNDAEGEAVFGLFFMLWLIISMFAFLLAMARSFHRNGKKKRESVVCVILGVGVVLFLVIGYLAVKPFSYEYAFTIYGGGGEIVHNSQYVGELEVEGVKISTRDKKKVSRISEGKLGIEPEQIALGRDYYYLYGNRMLVKLNYNSDIVAKREIGRACRLTCRNGYLFIGTYEDKEDGPPDMVYAFYANRYLSESEFEKGKIKSCKADSSGRCLVAGITLYDHEGKYFSDNPCLPGYEGINYYNSIGTDEQEKGAKTVWTTLVEDMLREKGLSDNRHMVCEYQKGDYLYGVVNVWEDVFSSPIKS